MTEIINKKKKTAAKSEILTQRRKIAEIRLDEAEWLTVWASWLWVSCTSVGLCLHFLGFGVRSAWPFGPRCESTLRPVSSPTLRDVPPPQDGMFSLLVSALMDGALLSDGKQRGEEMRHLPSIFLSLTHVLVFSSLTSSEILQEKICQAHPHPSFTYSPLSS